MSDDAVFARIAAALRAGWQYYTGGEDYRGNEFCGGDLTIYAEGDVFIERTKNWSGRGNTRVENEPSFKRFDEAGLRGHLTKSGELAIMSAVLEGDERYGKER